MRRLLQLLALALMALTPPLAAKAPYYYYSPYHSAAWVPVGAPRQASPLSLAERAAIATYGPFRVLDGRTAALVGVTDGRTPAAFQRMLRDFPGIARIRFVECPGTYDDRANLELGRMIRAAGIAAEVPAGGSVRSGAVELVLAGSSLSIDDRAQFAVHAWLDEDGFGANDYAADSLEHRKYLSYYREMGMGADQAASFYAMTNATPFESAHWLTGAEMRSWVGRAAPTGAPTGAPAPARAKLAEATSAKFKAAPASQPAIAFAPATAFLSPMPLPVVEPAPQAAAQSAPRLAYLDLGLTLY